MTDSPPGNNVRVQCWSCGSLFVTAEDSDSAPCPSCGTEVVVEDHVQENDE